MKDDLMVELVLNVSWLPLFHTFAVSFEALLGPSVVGRMLLVYGSVNDVIIGVEENWNGFASAYTAYPPHWERMLTRDMLLEMRAAEDEA